MHRLRKRKQFNQCLTWKAEVALAWNIVRLNNLTNMTTHPLTFRNIAKNIFYSLNIGYTECRIRYSLLLYWETLFFRWGFRHFNCGRGVSSCLRWSLKFMRGQQTIQRMGDLAFISGRLWSWWLCRINTYLFCLWVKSCTQKIYC